MNNQQPKPRKTPRQRARRRQNKQTTLATPADRAIKSEPTAKTHVRRNAAPVFRQSREGMLITHREFVADVVRSVNAFATDSYIVNPGVSASFPWLSQVANRFESYTFERLDYIYEPMVPTTQPGTVMMAIDFDALDSAPANKTGLMAYQGAVRTAPWGACRLQTSAIDRRKMVPERYVRTGLVPTPSDLKTYDVGNLIIGTVGTGATAVTLGEVYVEYTIRLRTPQIPTSIAVSAQRKASQSGRIVGSGSAAGLNIISHDAFVTGDVNSPMAIVSNLTRGALHIDPRYNRFRLNYRAFPTTNWASAISSMFVNGRFSDGTFQFDAFDNPTSVASMRYGRPNYSTFQGTTTGNTLALLEDVVFGEDETSSGFERGTGRTSIPLIFNNPTNNVTIEYTLTPLETEVFPLNNPLWAGLATGVMDSVIQFPTVSNTIGRIAEIKDDINNIKFNSREVVVKGEANSRSSSKSRIW